MEIWYEMSPIKRKIKSIRKKKGLEKLNMSEESWSEESGSDSDSDVEISNDEDGHYENILQEK